MFFYNQRNYENVDYSKPNGQKATVKSGGCGVCSALMALNNLYGKEVMTVKQMADFSKANGGRNNYGTDLFALLNALCKKYDLTYKTTSLNKDLLAHLKAGGVAIINQGESYNVFSTAGHFVLCLNIVEGETIRCLDPDLYSGKYQSYNRQQRIVKQTGNEVWVTLKEIGKATIDRDPSYYLISKKVVKPTVPSVKVGQTLKLKRGARVYAESNSKKVLKISDFSQFNVSAEALLKVGAKVQVASVVKNSNGNIWVYVSKYKGWICIWDGKTSKV